MKHLEYLETRAKKIAEEMDAERELGEALLKCVLLEARREYERLGDNPRAEKMLDNIYKLAVSR